MIKKTLLISFCLINLNSIGCTSEEDGPNPPLNGLKVVSGPDIKDRSFTMSELDREELNKSRSERKDKWKEKIEELKKTHKADCEPSPQRKKQLKTMKKEGIFIEKTLKGSGNLQLVREQIEEKKEGLEEVTVWLDELEAAPQEDRIPSPIDLPSMRRKLKSGYNDWNSLEAWEEEFKNQPGFNERLSIFNFKRHLNCPGFNLRKQEIETAKKSEAPVPIHHSLTTTSNLKRCEKVIRSADGLLWDAFFFSGHRNAAIERERAERAEAEVEELKELLKGLRERRPT